MSVDKIGGQMWLFATYFGEISGVCVNMVTVIPHGVVSMRTSWKPTKTMEG